MTGTARTAGLDLLEEAMLLDDGSAQRDVWGINLYPASSGDGFLEFDSMIHVRPSQNNPSRDVVDEGTRALELFDLTAADPRWKGPARRKVLRARDLFCGLRYSVAASPGDSEFLERYFLQFVVAARQGRQVD